MFCAAKVETVSLYCIAQGVVVDVNLEVDALIELTRMNPLLILQGKSWLIMKL